MRMSCQRKWPIELLIRVCSVSPPPGLASTALRMSLRKLTYMMTPETMRSRMTMPAKSAASRVLAREKTSRGAFSGVPALEDMSRGFASGIVTP